MHLRIALALVFSQPALGFLNDTCACLTKQGPSGLECKLAPGYLQQAVSSRLLKPGEKCTEEICAELYKEHRELNSDNFHSLTCSRLVVDPDKISDVVSCDPTRPTMLSLSLTAEFDKTSSVNIPAPYQSLRYDANVCNIDNIVKSVGGYIGALVNLRCSCKNLLFNINSHGDGEGEQHYTLCNHTVDGKKQQAVRFSTRELMDKLQAEVQAQGCEQPTFAIDSCFSTKAVEDLKQTKLRFPVVTSSHSNCLAPGESNLWSKYETWCHRCDQNSDDKVELSELSSCILTSNPTFSKVQSQVTGKIYSISNNVGPWSVTSAKDADPHTILFLCPPRASDPAANGPAIIPTNDPAVKGRSH